MPLFAVAFSSNTITNGSVLNGVKTNVRVSCDGQIYEKDTYASTVLQALEDTPCKPEKNDIIEPSQDTKLSGGSYDISVVKSMPVTIMDGSKVIMAKSAYRNGRDILKQLGIKVHAEDDVMTELIISDFYKNGLGQKITINRAPAVTLEADGNILEVRTHAKTVGDFLKEKGVVVGPRDELTPSAKTAIANGIKVSVVRVKESEVVENVSIPFGTVSKNDTGLYVGQSRVESEGTAGQKKVISKVVYKNGKETVKTVIKEEILKAPQNRVVVAGSKPYGAGDLWSLMVEAGAKYGIDPGKMHRVMMCESGGNVFSNGRYKGLFQWDNSFYKWTSIAGVPGDYFNPRSQIFATAARVKASGGWRAWPVCGYR